MSAPGTHGRQTGRRGTLLLAAAVTAAFVGVGLWRGLVLEPARQEILGRYEPPGRRLALASQFAFSTAGGARVRMVPGAPALDLADLPGHAVTLVLGGFRGPYAAYLWIKVEEEKQQKLHFDLMDRYTKIAALQSDYPQVWGHHIWNICWNVTAQWHSLERKYEWIRRGIEFGVEGYRKNPRSALIMNEIGRVYGEKLGRSQEADYYRRRVLEDEGRSTFLIAYEWYDRARKTHDRYGTSLGRGLTTMAIYAQACHTVGYYATELTLGIYDRLAEAARLQRAGDAPAARAALEAALADLPGAVDAWRWAAREWADHIERFETEIPSETYAQYVRFYTDGLEAAEELRRFADELTLDRLPRYHASALAQDAYNALAKSLRVRMEGYDEAARGMFDAAVADLDAALAVWDEAVASAEAALEAAEDPARRERLAEGLATDRAFRDALRDFRGELTYERLPLLQAERLAAEARRRVEQCLAAARAGRADEVQTEYVSAMRLVGQALNVARTAPDDEALTAVADRLFRAGQLLDRDDLVAGLAAMPDVEPAWPDPPVTWPGRGLSLRQ